MKNKTLKKIATCSLVLSSLFCLNACNLTESKNTEENKEDTLLQEAMQSYYETFKQFNEALDLTITIDNALKNNNTGYISQHAYSYTWGKSATKYDVYLKRKQGEAYVTTYIVKSHNNTPYLKITNGNIQLAKLNTNNSYYYDTNTISLTEETAKKYKILTSDMITQYYNSIQQAKFISHKEYVINTETGTWTKDTVQYLGFRDRISYYKSYNDYLSGDAYAIYSPKEGNVTETVYYDYCTFTNDETKIEETFTSYTTIYNNSENAIPSNILLEN